MCAGSGTSWCWGNSNGWRVLFKSTADGILALGAVFKFQQNTTKHVHLAN